MPQISGAVNFCQKSEFTLKKQTNKDLLKSRGFSKKSITKEKTENVF
jgi:hypothetical protein